jgi:AcrR family transcriptional regulator
VTWEERAVARSAAVQRSKSRIAAQGQQLLDAAATLIRAKGDEFTTMELAAEAGVALQTFYRYFGNKDELLLAVIGDALREACERWELAGATLPGPLERLHYYITAPLERLDGDRKDGNTARFVVSARWRIHRKFPEELANAEKPLVDLLTREVNAATAAGLLKPNDPHRDTWFLAELVRSTYHHYAFADHSTSELEVVKERLWRFCLRALGGAVQDAPGPGPAVRRPGR